MRIRLPKAAAKNLGLECGKSLLEVYVDKENNNRDLHAADPYCHGHHKGLMGKYLSKLLLALLVCKA